MRRVRLQFVVGLAATLLVLAHSIWDYVESRGLRARIDAIAKSGAPVTLDRYYVLSGDAAAADRFYRAAAALAPRPLPADPQVAHRLSVALKDGNWTPDRASEIRAVLDSNREALAFTDRAAPLPFEGLERGWRSGYVGNGGMALSRLCELRAVERALAGDADAAFDSLYSDVRLERLIGRPPPFAGLGFVVGRVSPSAAARSRLAQALAEIDRDDRLRDSFVRLRAQMIDSRRQERVTWPWFVEPWTTHLFVGRLDMLAAVIDAAGRPAPERMSAVMAVGSWPAMSTSPERSRALLESFAKGAMAETARIRCARRLVAGEVVDCQP